MLSGLLALVIGLAVIPAAARAEEDEDAFAGEEIEGQEDAEGEDTENIAVADPNAVYHEKTLADFDVNSPALYKAKISDVIGTYSIYSEKDTKSKAVVRNLKNTPVDVIYVGLVWVIVRYEGQLGYVKREYLTKNFVAYDPVNTPPFNVQKHQYIATVARECYVRKTMTKEPLEEKNYKSYWVKLNPGTRISIWQFQDGWAIVNYMRSYGYIDPNDLKDLIPVSPTDQPISKESPIARTSPRKSDPKNGQTSTPDRKSCSRQRRFREAASCSVVKSGNGWLTISTYFLRPANASLSQPWQPNGRQPAAMRSYACATFPCTEKDSAVSASGTWKSNSSHAPKNPQKTSSNARNAHVNG